MDDKELVEVWRKEFEKIYSNGVNVDRHNEGDYVRDSTEYLWQGFIMAKRSQPVIELPKREWFVDGLEHKTIIKKDVIFALTAAGIKYTIGE